MNSNANSSDDCCVWHAIICVVALTKNTPILHRFLLYSSTYKADWPRCFSNHMYVCHDYLFRTLKKYSIYIESWARRVPSHTTAAELSLLCLLCQLLHRGRVLCNLISINEGYLTLTQLIITNDHIQLSNRSETSYYLKSPFLWPSLKQIN